VSEFLGLILGEGEQTIQNIDNEFIVKNELLHIGRTESAEIAAKGYLRIMEDDTKEHVLTF
jgi:hypothetical protein